MTNLAQGSVYEGPVMAMLIDNLDGVGLDALKEFNRKHMLLQGLVEPETEEEAAMLEQVGQEPDGEAELQKAITAQQNAEAENLQTDSELNLAQAEEKRASAAVKRASIGQTNKKINVDARKAALSLVPKQAAR